MLIYKEVSIIDDSGENSIMDESLKPLIKRQLLLMGVSLGIYFVVTYFFGFMAGFIANIAVLLAIIFFIRRKQPNALRMFGFSNKSTYSNHEIKLKYTCLACGAEVKGLECDKCGSKMKKPIF
jgi:hypothetical protein